MPSYTKANTHDFRYWPSFLPLLRSYDIVDTYAIVAGQPDQKFHRYRPRPLFIAPVYLPLAAQNVSHLLLGQIVVHPQVLQSLKLHITTS